ncbi:MAG: TetR/AcrR family transcriptional regulator [Rubrivivax sp.]|nr:TetR/AcrR family transcriptional regulator [Rubrivivax sp.]
MSRADAPTPIETNQQGQTLGRKGLQTRQKLMAAARKLLDVYSPVELTAVSIAKEAGTSSASFYMYFEDVRDILYALAGEAAVDMATVHEVVRQLWEPAALHRHALGLVQQFNGVWERQRQVLRFRNMEADRGDPRFEALRMSTYVPFIDLLARQLIAACPKEQVRPTLSQAFALASVLHAAMERLASTDPAVVARGVGAHKLNDALAHVIQSVFMAGAPGAAGAAAGAGGVARKAVRKTPAQRKPQT